MAELGELVEKVRSKNAGPFWLTIDIFCGEPAIFQRICNQVATPTVADLFQVAESSIKRFEINSLPNIPNIEYKPTLVILADVLYYLSEDNQKICMQNLSKALHPRSRLIITSVYGKSYFLPIEFHNRNCAGVTFWPMLDANCLVFVLFG